MPEKKNKNNNLTKPPAIDRFNAHNMFVILFCVTTIFVLILMLLNAKSVKKEVEQKTIDDQIYSLAKKTKPSNFDLNKDLGPNVDEETGLPPVDQEKLGQDYIKDLKELIATLEQQIQPAGQESTTDFEAIKIIKKKAMSEVVPRQYKDLHIDFVRALDLIIEGDIDGAMNKLEQIKNKL